MDMPGKLKVQGVEEEGSAAMEEGEGFNLNELIGTDSLSKGVFGFRGKRQSPSAGTYTYKLKRLLAGQWVAQKALQ